MGSRVKMFGKKETVTSVRDTSERHWEANRAVFIQDHQQTLLNFSSLLYYANKKAHSRIRAYLVYKKRYIKTIEK